MATMKQIQILDTVTVGRLVLQVGYKLVPANS